VKVLPAVYIDRYVSRPLARTADGSPGRHDEWSTLLLPHAAAALSRRSDTSRATAAAAALTSIAAAVVTLLDRVYDDVDVNPSPQTPVP
jgi:hypothetical protein